MRIYCISLPKLQKLLFEMETGLNQTLSELSAVLNVSNTSAQLSLSDQTFKWSGEEIARMLQIVVRPILIIIGTTGNFSTVYIMTGTSLKDVSSCFYMTVLSLADTRKFKFNLHKIYYTVRHNISHTKRSLVGVILSSGRVEMLFL